VKELINLSTRRPW